MQYESKVIRVDYYTKTAIRMIQITEKGLEEIIDKEGLLGWRLSSSVMVGNKLNLFFQREKQSLAEMV